MATTYNEDGSTTKSIRERQEAKKKSEKKKNGIISKQNPKKTFLKNKKRPL